MFCNVLLQKLACFVLYLTNFFYFSYAKGLIRDTIQRNASPVRLEQAGEKLGIGGSSSSLNSSASDESNRLQHNNQMHPSSQVFSPALNDEYKHTVIVGNESLKITGGNLNLVWVI